MSTTLGRAALVVSAGVLASRILGFLREVILAGLLGAGVETDLYRAAFTIPDYLFFLMAGGYLTITFVPIVSRHMANNDPAAVNRSFTAVFKVMAILMGILTVTAAVFARPITEALFPEIAPNRVPQLVGLVRVVLPAQFFFVLGSLFMAIQYSHRRFLIPTLAPLIYNLAIIAGGLTSALFGEVSPAGFIWGALAGAAFGNFALQWWGAYRLGARLVGGVTMRDPTVAEYFSLAFPLMIGQSAVALDEVFFRVFGQIGGEGAIASLGYARQVNMVPVGVIAQAAGVASYPFLAGLFAENKLTEMYDTVRTALRSSLVVAGLGAAGVIGLALPAIQLAFQRGEFDSGATVTVASLLAIYGLSIPLWAAHQVYTRGFYASRRMWLPVVIGTATTLLAVPGYVLAASQFGARGVAGASVAVMAVYTMAIGWWWHRTTTTRAPWASVGRVIVATVPAGLTGWLTTNLLMPDGPTGTARAGLTLAVGAVVVTAVYLAILGVLRDPDLKRVQLNLARKFGKRKAGNNG